MGEKGLWSSNSFVHICLGLDGNFCLAMHLS